MAKHGQENQPYGIGGVIGVLSDVVESFIRVIPPPKPKPAPKTADKKQK